MAFSMAIQHMWKARFEHASLLSRVRYQAPRREYRFTRPVPGDIWLFSASAQARHILPWVPQHYSRPQILFLESACQVSDGSGGFLAGPDGRLIHSPRVSIESVEWDQRLYGFGFGVSVGRRRRLLTIGS